MKDKLEQYLDELVLLLKDGGAFALEQLPIFVQEYLTYYAWYHGIMGFLLLIPAMLFVWGAVWVFRNADEEAPIGLFPLGVGFVFVFFSGLHFLSMLKILIAPRVYLIENLTNLL